MLSTFHDAHTVEKTRRSEAVQGGVEEVQKPAVVEDYIQHMGGVDKSKNNYYTDGVICDRPWEKGTFAANNDF